MKTISVSSIKGGTGKTTLSIILVNALTKAGYRCLVVDADASNNSLSSYFQASTDEELNCSKTIFDLFMGAKVKDCVINFNTRLDLIWGDVRLNDLRSTDSLKKLKRALTGLDYDFCIIDTSPTYDNIIGNVLTASDILIIPVLQDVFGYQALHYQFDKLADLELDELDVHVVFSQFEKPLNDNQGTYRNQITNMFLKNERFQPAMNQNRISRSSVYRKYINKQDYRIDMRPETEKCFAEIQCLIRSILLINITGAI